MAHHLFTRRPKGDAKEPDARAGVFDAFGDQMHFRRVLRARHGQQFQAIVDCAHGRYQVMTDAAADQCGKFGLVKCHRGPVMKERNDG